MVTRLEHVLAHLVPPQQLRQQGLLAARAASSGYAILPPTALRVPAVPKLELARGLSSGGSSSKSTRR